LIISSIGFVVFERRKKIWMKIGLVEDIKGKNVGEIIGG